MKILLPDGHEININRVVVKLGTKQITDLNNINLDNIQNLVSEVTYWKNKGIEFILVVSGAIGLGIFEYYKNSDVIDKLTLSQKQALAGIGQIYLMELFKNEFKKNGITVGQVLLTHYIFENRNTYLNARNTLNSMLEMGVVPIINENDSVATEEIKFGDNDRLGAYVSLLIDSNIYIMLSDIDGLYKDYGLPTQEFIKVVDNLNEFMKYAGAQKEKFTKGGMITKLQAAKITTMSGIPSVIACGFKKNIITKIFDNLSEGTIFLPSEKFINYKKRWITSKRPKGFLYIDNGAVIALKNNKSLLPSGVKNFHGNFKKNDTLLIFDIEGKEVGMGLSNYDSEQLKLVMGKKSSEIKQILGDQIKSTCVIHIDNMIVFN